MHQSRIVSARDASPELKSSTLKIASNRTSVSHSAQCVTRLHGYIVPCSDSRYAPFYTLCTGERSEIGGTAGIKVWVETAGSPLPRVHIIYATNKEK